MSLFVDVEKQLGAFRLCIQLEAEDEVLALLGASGCGKSMTLKCIAGVERPDRGRIVVDGKTLFDSRQGINLSPQARHTGLLFQNYALFPHMTVAQNICAGARRERDAARRKKHADAMVERFGLTPLMGLYPRQLSGGQQQRVALARILVSDPDILLLDEPFSALDSHLRFRLEQEVGAVLRAFGKTAVLVSHDRDEVFRLSNRLAVIHDGAVEVCGTKHAVFDDPQTCSAAVLTGCKNISRIRPLGACRVEATDWGMPLELARDAPQAGFAGIRMHDILPGPGVNTVVCRVAGEMENPFSCTVLLTPADRPDAVPVGWEVDKSVWAQLRAQRVTVHLPPEKILLLRK